METPTTLHYFHVHDGKDAHADDESYTISIVCAAHLEEMEAAENAEYITEVTDEDEHCDKCEH